MQVSVLMPAYNVERYVAEATESVLSQTYENFEFLIIDDGSTDGTLPIVESYARKDERVRVISHANMGMGASLNQALDLARNEWIVRMDADDIMLPHRIERQVAFVKDNPDVAVASTGSYFIDEGGRIIGNYQPPLKSRAHVKELIQHNELIAFHHPSVIMRRSVVKKVGGYRPEFWPCDDLDLWNRIAERGYVILNQPEYLLRYRKYGFSGSFAKVRLTWSKIDWVKSCMLSRRRGDSEPSWQQFLATRRQVPWWERLNQERQVLAKVLYTAAVSYLSSRRYHLFAPALLGAALLQPSFVSGRVMSRSSNIWKATAAANKIRWKALIGNRKS